LRVKYEYGEEDDMKSHVSLVNLNLAMGASSTLTVLNIPSSSNNLSFLYYSSSAYLLAELVKYAAYILTGVALLFFLAGNLGAKLAALESIAVFQLAALLQFNLSSMTPTFAALAPLAYSLGFTPLLAQPDQQYYEQEDLPANFKGQNSRRNGLLTLNFALVLLVVPLLVGVVLRVASARRPHVRLLAKAWRNSFGTYFFYSLLFLAYGELACLAIGARYLTADLDSIIGVTTGSAFAIVLGGYLIALEKYDAWMGSFRNKFKKYSISQHFYTFSATERVVTVVLIVFSAPSKIGPAGVSAVLLLEIVFLAVNKPYVL
jgi:hypothetical protein